MNNKLFSFLIVLMTLSLLGIIFVQGYWIKNSYDNREDQFTLNIRQVLISVSREIQLEEITDALKSTNAKDAAKKAKDQEDDLDMLFAPKKKW